jgi:hypothetical protein
VEFLAAVLLLRFIPWEVMAAPVASRKGRQEAKRARTNRSATGDVNTMAKIAKTGDRKKMMDTNKSTDCPKCSKPTRIVKRVKDRERGIPGGVYISCSACEFFEKL